MSPFLFLVLAATLLEAGLILFGVRLSFLAVLGIALGAVSVVLLQL